MHRAETTYTHIDACMNATLRMNYFKRTRTSRNVDKHRDHRGTRRGNSSSHHRRDKRDRKRSPESGEDIVARDDQARRKNRRPRRKYQSGGGHGNHRRSRAGSGGTYPRQRSKTGRESGGGARKSVTIEQAKVRTKRLHSMPCLGYRRMGFPDPLLFGVEGGNHEHAEILGSTSPTAFSRCIARFREHFE